MTWTQLLEPELENVKFEKFDDNGRSSIELII